MSDSCNGGSVNRRGWQQELRKTVRGGCSEEIVDSALGRLAVVLEANNALWLAAFHLSTLLKAGYRRWCAQILALEPAYAPQVSLKKSEDHP
jgi:hypothetical protein